MLVPMQFVPVDYGNYLEFYYTAIAGIFTFLIYWFIIRHGYVIHVMQPLGNIGQQKQTSKIETEIKDADGNVTGKETKEVTVTGDAGIYHEIAKKKISFSNSGKTINFFATKKELKLGIDYNSAGKSYLIDNSGVSYLHWRNRHIYLDSESMLPIKLQAGTYKPSSRLWFQLFELGLIVALHKGASTAPTKKSNTNTTLFLVFALGGALGYFVAILYGHQLSPAFTEQTTTHISSTISTIIAGSHTTTTTIVNNGTTTTITEVLPSP